MNLTYLKEMLDSLVKQSVKDFDLIVVNDGLEEFSNLVSCYSDILNILEISGGVVLQKTGRKELTIVFGRVINL